MALVHATHPISELYDLMKPKLREHDSDFDIIIQKTLLELGEKMDSDVTREDAQIAIDDAKKIIKQARQIVIEGELSSDTTFQLELIMGLLATSKAEYEESVSNGKILEMVKFQDESAFVWKSKEIFNKIRANLPEHEVEEIEEFYEGLWNAYEQKMKPIDSGMFVDGIIHEVNEILGDETEEEELQEYVENIELLIQVKTEYEN